MCLCPFLFSLVMVSNFVSSSIFISLWGQNKLECDQQCANIFQAHFFLSRLVYDLKEPWALRYDVAITNAGWTEVNRTKKFGELKKKTAKKNKVQKQQTIYRPVSFSNAYHHLASGWKVQRMEVKEERKINEIFIRTENYSSIFHTK